ncbi:MAG: hypothetical protein LBB53_03495 [Prevotellaceae bacterium]|jgi:hypothetical protein|nr:hypothetical protein [Prevotellaceae bacterium]
MEEKKNRTITVKPAQIREQIEIEPDENVEQPYRIAEEIFNSKVKYYEQNYGGKERQDILRLAGYDITVCFLRYINSSLAMLDNFGVEE